MNLIILDTETTGTEVAVDRLVELAAVDLNPLGKSFSTLVDPERGIPPEAMAIHHITPAECVGAPTEREALALLRQELDPTIIAAHNAKFDRGFIDRIAPINDFRWVCTYKCAVMAWPDAPGHSNQVLRYWLGLDLAAEIPEGLFPHRALYDTIVTRGILLRLLQEYHLDQLIEWSSGPILLPKVTFGKHKGEAWNKVPFGYLKWCVSQSGMNEDVRYTAEYYMRRK